SSPKVPPRFLIATFTFRRVCTIAVRIEGLGGLVESRNLSRLHSGQSHSGSTDADAPKRLQCCYLEGQENRVGSKVGDGRGSDPGEEGRPLHGNRIRAP